jgi:murein DD-endopeptidase MepM/ murein hydrolase activator NlpD
MRRILTIAAAAACTAVLAGPAPAQTFTVVSAAPKGLPSYTEPNAPGSIAVPFSLSRPPAHPAVLSHDDLLDLWQRAGAAYGVPWPVLAAINKIESAFGRNMGPSSAGALGWMQFIPSSWERWGMDADGDGLANPWDPEDAVYAAARYLAAAGAHEDLARAIYAYNHAQWYVDDVLELAELFAAGGALAEVGPLATSPSDLFRLDELDSALAAARKRVTRAKRALPAAEERIEGLEWRLLELEQRAGDPSLTDKAFRRLEARIAELAAGQDAARAELEHRQVELEYAVTALDELRSQAATATALSAPAASYLGAPQAVGGYVFPVGGGPGVVSVAHDHHDYPAADIAAPEGTPVYALANALVTEAYANEADGGKCGIGFKLALETGAAYVYCHLAYLEPDIVPGAALAAGTPVGLVGSTGNSTGPHLHLAFDPAVLYPQEEPWFAAFAGSAFSWQDAPTPTTASPKPAKRVFHIVDELDPGFAQPLVALGAPVITFTR